MRVKSVRIGKIINVRISEKVSEGISLKMR